MASSEPVDIDQIERDEIGEEDDDWGDNLLTDLERKFEDNSIEHWKLLLMRTFVTLCSRKIR